MAKRWSRRPRFPFSTHSHRLYKAIPIHVSEVAAGETLREMDFKARIETQAVIPSEGAYVWAGFYFVPYRLVDAMYPEFIMGDGALTIPDTTSASETSVFFSDQTGRPWAPRATDVIWAEYFDQEGVGSGESAINKPLPNPDSDWTRHILLGQADKVIPADATLNELDALYADRDFEMRQMSWDGSYKRYLQSQGVTVSEEAISIPERIFQMRRFVEPLEAIDGTGDTYRRFDLMVDRKLRSPKYFEEAGLLIGYVAVMPRVMLLTPDVLGKRVDADQFPQKDMRRGQIVWPDKRFYSSTSPDEMSGNEVLYKGRHLLRRGNTASFEGAGTVDAPALVHLPTTRVQAIFPSMADNFWNGTDYTGNLEEVFFGIDPADGVTGKEMSITGLVTTKFNTPVSRNGIDFDGRLAIEGG